LEIYLGDFTTQKYVSGAKNILITIASLKEMGRLFLHYFASITLFSMVRGGHFSTRLAFYPLEYLKVVRLFYARRIDDLLVK